MRSTKNTFAAIILPILTVTITGNLVSCGTIMYPERNGQKAGQIDPLVAVLDGVGLLFFLLPGVIAFAVDFNNHSIYLSHAHTSSNGPAHTYSRIRFNGKLDEAGIEKLVRAETGVTVNLQQANMQVVKLDSTSDLDARFAMTDSDIRVAMAH
jgi:hypothetical protein